MKLILNQGQQAALQDLLKWLSGLDPSPEWVLSGWAGSGKSTMLRELLEDWPATEAILKQMNPQYTKLQVVLCATTNKACRALELAMGIGKDVITVHKHFGLKVQTIMSTGKKVLVPARNQVIPRRQLIIIDEASMIDKELLGLIVDTPIDCKLLFMGDPTQLTPVKSKTTPAFDQGWGTSYLTQLMRQSAGNPIATATDLLREFVINPVGEFPSIELSDPELIHVDQDTFCQYLMDEFSNPDWTANTSKVLAWKNDTVKAINEWVREGVEGHPQLQAGDIAVVNRFQNKDGLRLPTDAIVMIDECRIGNYQVNGKLFSGSYLKVESFDVELFVPDDVKDYDRAIKLVLGTRELYTIQADWADIRAAYACTIHKSQGSSLDKVFIDLGDFNSTVDRAMLARLLYVAISRARHQVILTGDISWL